MSAAAYDVLPRLLADAALAGVDVADLLSHACTEATRMLPRGMSLTDARPGSWEASHVDGLIDPAAVAEGPGAGVLDVDCPRCGASPGEGCWGVRAYADRRHPHPARRRAAEEASAFVPGLGWVS